MREPELQEVVKIDQFDMNRTPFRFSFCISAKTAGRYKDPYFSLGANDSPERGDFLATRRLILVLYLNAYVRCTRP